MLLRRFESFEEQLTSSIKKLDDGQIIYLEAGALFKSLRMELEKLYKLSRAANFDLSNDLKQQIESSLKELKDFVTDTPKDTTPEQAARSPIRVENGIIYLTPLRLYEIKQEHDKLSEMLFKIQIEINQI